MELPEGRKRDRSRRWCMDIVKEDKEAVGVMKKDMGEMRKVIK